MKNQPSLPFHIQTVTARFIAPDGNSVDRPIEIRTNPITGRTSRITYSRSAETERGAEALRDPPADALDKTTCPFCTDRLAAQTPRIHTDLSQTDRLRRGDSVLFPNLYPYGQYSAVSLIGQDHYVPIGRATAASYADSFINAAEYLRLIRRRDPDAVFMAVTQNHLPSAGGSLVHPHLQINADSVASTHHRLLIQRAQAHFDATGRLLLGDYLAREKETASRTIGATGPWEWVAAFAPDGFFEIWGILPGVTSFAAVTDADWLALAQGVCLAQKFYRSRNRNGYNLGLLLHEVPDSRLELRVVLVVRANYAPWARNDHTGFEVMLGDMATFTAPEDTAAQARPFWEASTPR